jgi:hypothetical protein
MSSLHINVHLVQKKALGSTYAIQLCKPNDGLDTVKKAIILSAATLSPELVSVGSLLGS